MAGPRLSALEPSRPGRRIAGGGHRIGDRAPRTSDCIGTSAGGTGWRRCAQLYQDPPLTESLRPMSPPPIWDVPVYAKHQLGTANMLPINSDLSKGAARGSLSVGRHRTKSTIKANPQETEWGNAPGKL
jgi:hypothetical protein